MNFPTCDRVVLYCSWHGAESLVPLRQRSDAAHTHLFPDLRHVAGRQDGHVTLQFTRVQGPLVLGTVQRFSEQDVVPHCGILDPRLLWHVGHPALVTKAAVFSQV